MPGLPALPPIGPYTVFYLLAVLAGGLLAWRQAVRHQLPRRDWLALVALAAAAGLAGSRLLHFDPAAAAGARTVLGGVLAGVLVLLLGVRFLRLDPRAPDSLAPVLPISLALGRMGCLLAGCCYGEPVHLPWAVLYDVHSPAYAAHLEAGLVSAAAVQSLPVHPTQLYEILVALVTLALLPRFRRVLHAPGSLALATLATLAAGRVAVEFFRPRGLSPVLGLDRVQWLLAALIAAALVAILVRERTRGRACACTPPEPPARGWRTAIILAGPAVLLALGGGHFGPLESAALVLLTLPAVLEVASRLRPRLAPATAFALLLPLSLQEIVLPPDSSGRTASDGYPRSFWSLGVSAATNEDRESRSVYRGEGDCGSIYDHYPVEVRHRVWGLTTAHTTQRSADRALTIRLRGFLGRAETEPVDPATVPPETRDLAGAGVDVGYDRYWVGVRAGAGVGQFQDHDDSSTAVGIVALRLGPLSSLHGFLAVNDLDPLGTPREDARVGIGMRLAGNGSTLRAGVWRDDSFFLHATVVAGPWEIEPFVAPGDQSEWRLAVRRRLAQR